MDQQDKSAHTPGPWYVRISDNATPHIEHGNCMLDEVGELRNRICVMPAEVTHPFNSLANARLIAAAPELYEALQNLVASWDSLYASTPHVEGIGDRHEDVEFGAMQMARAALAKAGSQQ